MVLVDKPDPRVGLGVIIVRKDGKILIGKRRGSHAPVYSIPGGGLELGETFEEGTIREIREETGMEVRNPQVVAVSNNVGTYEREGKHYISIVIVVKDFSGDPELIEPEKCEGWEWVDPRHLPEPHFEDSARAVACWLEGTVYKK